ncbi:MAG: cyclic nucleotide-binding domain-containing protein, partial [Synergistaceae bacterium]|nr:cyclic nucleotide-binding domain-containing protein [Synergistaceae bacterium]
MAVITLKQSEYLGIPSGDDNVYKLTSGRAEIYACTPEGAENYHKVFLAEIGPGEDFFPPMETHVPLEFSVFAVSDAKISKTGIERMTPNALAERSGKWFKKLTEPRWV